MNLWEELNGLGKSLAVCLCVLAVLGLSALAMQLVPVSTVRYYIETAAVPDAVLPPTQPITHVATPAAVRGIYMTACTASVPRLRERLVGLVEGTQINSIVIDIKDYTGTLAYPFPGVKGPRGKGCRIGDLPDFLAELHKKGIYAIARVTVFQDPLYSEYDPKIAVKSISNPGSSWRDRKGLAYIDPNFTAYWTHIVDISKAAHAIGFDEINFDYIRFPSDGDMADAGFETPEGLTKLDVITDFFQYLHAELAPLGIVTSADLFGQTTVNRDDLGIGQVLENALPYFDYVMPMNYPSHFIRGFMGFDNPAAKPYEVMLSTMTSAVERTAAASTSIEKLRPWLQAFDLGAAYTPEMVRAQIQAVENAGLDSWVLWDAANRYDRRQFASE